MSFCVVPGCPGQGFPYRLVILRHGRVEEIILCTTHRKMALPEGVELLSIEKADPGYKTCPNPYERASEWGDPGPVVLPD